ncbi:MAG: tryptophan--tRNA ligase [Candidatus Omnitrophica bacterium]|nr:tryptophan--tRNA ligase [Candidatus Omnitrophota bacterium]
MSKKIILSGMRPTGKLHLGHWVGALSNWVSLQDSYDCFFMVADWHALMSEYKDPSTINESTFDNVCDWLTCGIDPERSVIFVQSQVKEHLELLMIFSALVPLGWLSRCPTFKEQVQQLKDKEINTYGFLGYPALQAADIALYMADCVPVGEDQLPHLELTREIVRRFNFIYANEVLKEPQPLLTKAPRFLGLDLRKMSKSYNNYISLDEDDEEIDKKVSSMITDPARKTKKDPGHPEICNVYSYYSFFSPEMKQDVYKWCTKAEKGCVECKKILSGAIKEFIAPKREKKMEITARKDYVYDILDQGRKKAQAFAAKTMKEVRAVMKF